ncbi:hypothetical protein ACQ0P8_08605 [Halodesulfovibrio aestuarii]|uniref:Uncharacterized protein n=1 Tax=Halodesulfovibrio aestuarii TaxID=126333 RepID=A0A8G2FB19_9BACT|nr:hypothetical protein [Halodesulfovibrio aestuarii]SHJ07591.1 hypothetical protein SAMN05660830_01565 [Halodesulfovibrio aestuarii]
MTTKRNILIIVLLIIGATAIVGSFALIKQNKELAAKMLKDANSQKISVTCDKIDAGILSIEYSDLKIHEKSNNNSSEAITITNLTITKSPSLATLISQDMKQGKTTIHCNGVLIPLTAPVSNQYGSDVLELNLSTTSVIQDENVHAISTIDIPKLGSITSTLALKVNPKLYELKGKVDGTTFVRNIALNSFEFTLENNGGVQKLLAANNIQEDSIKKAEHELQKLSAVDYKADLKSFIDGSKKLSLSYSFPNDTSVPLSQLFLAFLMKNPNDPSKIKIASF